jgi:hypothetical protein
MTQTAVCASATFRGTSVVVAVVFETIRRAARRPDRSGAEAVVGFVTAVAAAALLAFVALGPFVLSGLVGMPFATALRRVVVVAAVAYGVGMVLLLR